MMEKTENFNNEIVWWYRLPYSIQSFLKKTIFLFYKKRKALQGNKNSKNAFYKSVESRLIRLQADVETDFLALLKLNDNLDWIVSKQPEDSEEAEEVIEFYNNLKGN